MITGEKQITVNGKEHVLKMDMLALANMEDRFHCNAVLVFRQEGALPSYSRAADVLAIMTGLKRDAALGVVQAFGLAETVNACSEVIDRTLNPDGLPGGKKAARS